MKGGYFQSESKAVSAIKKAIPPSLKKDMLSESRGMFAELFSNDEVFPEHYIASAIDGVGTKLIIAEALGVYDTVGIDCIAMSANDLATLGAVSPFLFMDCISCQSKIEEEAITGDIVSGISKGLLECDTSKIMHNSIRINFGKGETASVEELMSSAKPGYGFDLVGSMIGFIRREKVNFKVNAGDKIIALPSSGPHSNGYTALRHQLLDGDFETRPEFKKLYYGKFDLDDKFDGSSIGKVLLEPTRIYNKTIAKISKEFDIVGINNTGYGLKNFNRLKGNFKFEISNPLNSNSIFKLMQAESGFDDKQMYESFNMGMGFFVICKGENSDKILQIAKDGKVVGEVKSSPKAGTVLTKGNKKIIFEGY